jgi:GntR family transcriptional regulator
MALTKSASNRATTVPPFERRPLHAAVETDAKALGSSAPTVLNPLYLQVKQFLFERLRKGEWGPGELLPSEMKLAAEYHVHQGTIRKALDELAAQHLIIRKQGKGTFVASGALRHRPFYFMRIQPKSGPNKFPTTEFISCGRARASAEELHILRTAGSDVIRLIKVRRFDSKPAIAEHIAIRGDLFPGLEDLINRLRPETTYTLLEEKYRVLIRRVVERLSAVAASARDARLLGVSRGTPLLQISRIAYAVDGSPVEWRISRCNTRAHEYVVELS